MHNNLDKIHVIDSEKLNGEFYFEFLLEQALSNKLLKNSDIERLQYECLNLLAYKTERYHAGDSSSILIEQAQNIRSSILFSIGVWLKTYPHPDDAVIALQNQTISELYQKGREHIDVILAATKTLHANLTEQLLDTPNVFYCSTLVDGINGFFKRYDPDYAAQEMHITADYPLYHPVSSLTGIEFIHAYVTSAYFENLFCSYFDPDDIHHLLCGYAENYQELLINLYEPVLIAALGCSVAGVDILRLDVTESGKNDLETLFCSMHRNEIYQVLNRAASNLNHLFNFPQELIKYIQGSLSLIADHISIAVQQEMLDKIFLIPSYPENHSQFTFSFGEKMKDQQYRKMIKEIESCRFSHDKMTIIKEQVHSLADMEELLLDAELTRQEVTAILNELDLSEVAALTKRHPIVLEMEGMELRKQEQILIQCLRHYLSLLPKEQQIAVHKMSKAMVE